MRLHLYRRGDIWWIRGSEGGIKFRKSTRHTSESKARRIRDRWERELADPTHHRANKATVASAAERWVREISATKKAATVSFYKQKVAHVVRLLGKYPLSRIQRDGYDILTGYIEKRRAEGAHQHSIHRELTAARLTLRSAIRAKEFSLDPRIVVPTIKSGYVPTEAWVTAETVWAAIAYLPPERGAAVAYVTATAADFSNIFTAERADFEERTILVRGTKTVTRRRRVPRLDLLEPFTRHALAYAGTGAKLFGPWLKMAQDVRRACRRAKVPEFTARTLRHSVATWLAKAGVPFDIAMRFMGHGSERMLREVYAHMQAEDDKRLIDERTK